MIVSKFPKPGEAKTRLGNKIGNHESAVLARAMLDDLIVRMKGRYRHILVGREADRSDFGMHYPDLEFVSGGGRSQFNDIQAAIRHAFLSGDTERLIFMTSDAPTVETEAIDEGFRKLQSHAVVYSPSQDGAALIGVTRASTLGRKPETDRHASVASRSADGDRAAMQYFKSSHAGHPDAFHLPMIPDIDSLDDLIAHYSLLRPGHAPNTSRVLHRFATDEPFLFDLCCKVAEDSSTLDKRTSGGVEIIDESGPKIGAVITKDGKIVSTGHRFELGLGRHAEDCAIEKAGMPLIGAKLYSTFEPCTQRSSTFKLDCCADLIRKSGIHHIVYGTPDPQLPRSAKAALLPRGVFVQQSKRLAGLSAHLTSVYMEKLGQA